MGRYSFVAIALTIAALVCIGLFTGCGGAGTPTIIEPPPEAPAEIPDLTQPDTTPPVEQPDEGSLPQGTFTYPGNGNDWLLETFNRTGAGGDVLPPDPDDTIPPTSVLITGILSDYTAWGTVSLGLHAQDDKGINMVALAIDGKGVAINEEGGALHYTWNTRELEDGEHYFDILARDVGYNCVRCTVVVEVKNDEDAAPPVMVPIPYNPSYYRISGTGRIKARATDDKGITNWVVWLDDEEFYTTNETELNFTFNSLELSDGDYDLKIVAYDAVGKSAEEIKHLEVANKIPTCTLTGNVTCPTESSYFNCQIKLSRWVNPNVPHFKRPYPLNSHSEWSRRVYVDPTDGSFELKYVPVGREQVSLILGKLRIDIPVDLPEPGEYQIPAELTYIPLEGNESHYLSKVGVVTGSEEGLEHTLAKLGYGSVDSAGALILGTEVFSLIDGDNSLPDASYPNFDEFITDPGLLSNYDSLIIASGNLYERQFLTDQTAVASLKIWLDEGRAMYCGGTSYDFLEQTRPDRFDFGGADEMDGLGEVPEPFDAAMIGPAFETCALVVNNPWNYDYQLSNEWFFSLGFEDIDHPSSDWRSFIAFSMSEGWLVIDQDYSELRSDFVITNMEEWKPRSIGAQVHFRVPDTDTYIPTFVNALTAPADPGVSLNDVELLIQYRLVNQLYY